MVEISTRIDGEMDIFVVGGGDPLNGFIRVVGGVYWIVTHVGVLVTSVISGADIAEPMPLSVKQVSGNLRINPHRYRNLWVELFIRLDSTKLTNFYGGV